MYESFILFLILRWIQKTVSDSAPGDLRTLTWRADLPTTLCVDMISRGSGHNHLAGINVAAKSAHLPSPGSHEDVMS